MRTAIGVVFSAVSLAACGGGDKWLPQDIDRDAALEQLGDAGYARVCSAFEDYVREQYRDSHLVQAVCLAHGVQTASDAVTCGETVTACTETMPPAAEAVLDSLLAQGQCSFIEIEPTGCQATVKQLSACLDAVEGKISSVKFGLTCAAVGEPVPQDWWKIPMPGECAALRTLCPKA